VVLLLPVLVERWRRWWRRWRWRCRRKRQHKRVVSNRHRPCHSHRVIHDGTEGHAASVDGKRAWCATAQRERHGVRSGTLYAQSEKMFKLKIIKLFEIFKILKMENIENICVWSQSMASRVWMSTVRGACGGWPNRTIGWESSSNTVWHRHPARAKQVTECASGRTAAIIPFGTDTQLVPLQSNSTRITSPDEVGCAPPIRVR
jgi:hypothetical protein